MSEPLLLPEGVTVLERGWLSSNSVVISGAREAAVVDSGYWTHSSQTLDLVSQSIRGLDLTKLVNTHLHSDHCGGNAALQAKYPEVRTYIPPGLAEAVRNWNTVQLTYQPTGQHCPPFRFDDMLPSGTTIRLGDLQWQIHSAPGHDPHSVVLFEPSSRTLISADALWQNGFGVVFPELEGEEAFDDVSSTLDLIERLSPALVVPGHGSVFADVQNALGRARSRLDAYTRDPDRHAHHAAKVLLKFKLLELQQSPLPDLVAWADCTPYFRLLHQRWAGDIPISNWVEGLILDLVRSKAAEVRDQWVVNT